MLTLLDILVVDKHLIVNQLTKQLMEDDIFKQSKWQLCLKKTRSERCTFISKITLLMELFELRLAESKMFSQTNVTQREQETFTNKNMFGIVHGFIFLQNLSLISFLFYK